MTDTAEKPKRKTCLRRRECTCDDHYREWMERVLVESGRLHLN